MIFVITGTQEPFDRMIRVVDEVAAAFTTIPFIAQVSRSTIEAPHLQTFDFIPPVVFNQYVNEADLIISHAGMGTILTSLERSKPIIIMPRLVRYGEHRNDHQLATCRVFEKLGYLNVAYDGDELKAKLIRLISGEAYSMYTIGKYASDDLLRSLREFVTNTSNR